MLHLFSAVTCICVAIVVMVSDGSEDDTCGYDNSGENGNASYQVIKWTNHLPGDWFSLVDESGRDA